MAHQVLITFDINEEKEAGRIIAKQMSDELFGNYPSRYKIEDYTTKVIEKILEPYKDEIIEKAVKNVTNSLNRSKAVREAMKNELDK